MPVKRDDADWEAVEAEYRANKETLQAIANRYGVKESTIRYRAKKNGWQRDLAHKATKRSQELVARKSVADVADGKSDEQMVEAIAERTASVVESHRKDIRRSRDLAGTLMQELESQTINTEALVGALNQIADDEDMHANRRSQILKAVSLSQRAGVMRDLSQAMKTLQTLERTAYGIDGRESDRDPLDEIIDAVSDTSRGIDGYGR